MRQSRLMSLAEALTNVAVGNGVAVATQLLVFPLFGVTTTLRENLVIGAILHRGLDPAQLYLATYVRGDPDPTLLKSGFVLPLRPFLNRCPAPKSGARKVGTILALRFSKEATQLRTSAVMSSENRGAGNGRAARVRPVYVDVGIWFSEGTGEVHLAVSGFKNTYVTLTNKPTSDHGHPELYRKLARVLKEVGAPCPDL